MKIKLQDYSLISNDWIDEQIKLLEIQIQKTDLIYNPTSYDRATTRLSLLKIIKQKQLIPAEKLVDEVYDKLIGCFSNILSEKVLYDQRKQDFLNSEIEIQ
jgi:hypothetical protein